MLFGYPIFAEVIFFFRFKIIIRAVEIQNFHTFAESRFMRSGTALSISGPLRYRVVPIHGRDAAICTRRFKESFAGFMRRRLRPWIDHNRVNQAGLTPVQVIRELILLRNFTADLLQPQLIVNALQK